MVVEKVFRLMCSSERHLTADVIALALLKQITLNTKEPNVVFGVMELPIGDKIIKKINNL